MNPNFPDGLLVIRQKPPCVPPPGGFTLTNAGQVSVLSEPELLRAMFDVGYFPPNTPPDKAVGT